MLTGIAMLALVMYNLMSLMTTMMMMMMLRDGRRRIPVRNSGYCFKLHVSLHVVKQYVGVH